jgi:hypothetical protein
MRTPSVGLNQTSAVVSAGSSSATFKIRLPRWTGEDSLNTACLGVPRYLVVSPSRPRQIRYALTYFFRLAEPTYPFVLKTRGAGISRTMEDVSNRLTVHMENVARAFPLQASVPSLYYDTKDDNDPHWEVRLPPRSAIYSSDELFFSGLGFLEGYPLEVDEPQESVAMIGGRNRRKKVARVWGFYNHSYDEVFPFRGVKAGPGVTMDSLALAVADDFPADMQVQAELFEVTNVTDRRVVTLEDDGNRSAASLGTAVTALETMLETVKFELNLRYQLIDVATDGQEEIVLSNKPLVGTGCTIILIMDDEMSEAFQLPRQRSFIFYIDAPRSYSFRVPSAAPDPFKGCYPVTVVSQGFGPVVSWVEGLGYVNLFGVLREGGDRKAVESEGSEFDVNQTFLTLQFLDSARQPVVFAAEHQLDLMMKFTRKQTALGSNDYL